MTPVDSARRLHGDGSRNREVAIRAYGKSDWSAVCVVHDRARPDELAGCCDPRAFVPLAAERSDAESFRRSRKFVACLGEKVVGFVGVDDMYVSWLYVDPDYYRRGIGRLLLRFAVELIGSGAWTICLAENTRARHLYESEGFQVSDAFAAKNAGYPCNCVRLTLAPSTPVASGQRSSLPNKRFSRPASPTGKPER